MKNTIKNSKKGILMVIMFTTMLSFANNASLFNIKNEAKRTSLTLLNVKQGNLLSVKDVNGIVLYKESMQKSGNYTKGFDLTALPDGSYVFELDKDMEINTIPFTVKSNIVLFDKEKETTIYKPMFVVKDNVVMLTKLALKEAPCHIKIYFLGDHGEELMHAETVENTKTITKAYKLAGLKYGGYKIVCNSDGREFTKAINI
ncbi:hypothetical protein FPF71_00415 [Algibacter amylolyticus]|uniref:Uncharacterized protein n=1 Tax=Algibacter amylolyticus TaxID=1608400 RepID=A0A5M7BC94_9FLAO|nr:hypothetical protein [Algibacter amylolyticus]KAA5827343.1 hypothetical protein F2B50_00415 [Algibacter amylolyticus]MBB5266529.1 hypothetical protein [Algibacter amylolyticus]TSJ81588.1 hypothetical protein FPF71_00415 [Algibacter amylolyticus]